MIAKAVNCRSTASPISACRDKKSERLSHTDLSGRDRPRARALDRASRSRSVMSFQVQPAPRITKAPMKNSAQSQGRGRMSGATPVASAADHQHGISNSQEPIGRSKRDRRR